MFQRLDVYRRLFGYLAPYWGQVIIAYSAVIFGTLLKLLVPQIIKNAIDEGLAAGDATALFYAGGIILGLAVFLGLVAFGLVYNGLWLTHRVGYDLLRNFYNRLQDLPFSFYDQAQTGDLMSRATADIRETEQFVGVGLRDLMATSLLLAGVIVAMMLENPSLAILALLPIPVLIYAAIRFGGIVRPMFKRVQEQMGILATTMQESMTGIGLVKAFAREPYELEKFDRENEIWFDGRYRIIRVWANNWPFFTFILAISVFLLLWFGGPLTLQGRVTVGSLFAMISYILMLNGPVQRIGFLVNLASTAGASAGRIFEILDRPSEIAEAPDAIPLSGVRGQVIFDHVDFAYERKAVLHDLNFTIEAGQVVALMGLTGSGKSTLTNLIPRFYDPVAGRVLIDGVDIRQVTLQSLRQHIGIVLQNPLLFSATITENITYGRPDAPFEEVVAAAKAAGADKFIAEFPLGYDTMVGERGVTLSGGQKQRLAIARALLRDPRILILDDSTSSVDTETEYLIQQALAVLMEGRTTLIIAQRLLTLKNADLILVLDRGRIIERGTHQELLAQNGLYREIYDLQLKDQEEFTATQQEIKTKA
jgi:ATP-binding cassette subfamily B protein